MNLWSALRNLLGGRAEPPPPTYRNKPGGMAWVRGVPSRFGAETLNGQAVKTVRINEVGTWTIEPYLTFIAAVDCYLPGSGLMVRGQSVNVQGIEDCYLEPWKEIGDGARSEETTFQPTVPAREPGKVEA